MTLSPGTPPTKCVSAWKCPENGDQESAKTLTSLPSPWPKMTQQPLGAQWEHQTLSESMTTFVKQVEALVNLHIKRICWTNRPKSAYPTAIGRVAIQITVFLSPLLSCTSIMKHFSTLEEFKGFLDNWTLKNWTRSRWNQSAKSGKNWPVKCQGNSQWVISVWSKDLFPIECLWPHSWKMARLEGRKYFQKHHHTTQKSVNKFHRPSMRQRYPSTY